MKSFLDIVKKERGDSNYAGDQHGGASGSSGSGLPDEYAGNFLFATGIECSNPTIDNGRTRRIIKPRKVGKARRRWVGNGEDMGCQSAALIDNRHEVARRLDLSIVPPHISNDSDVKSFQ